MKRLFVLCVVLMLAGGPAAYAWGPDPLSSVHTAQIMELTGNAVLNAGLWDYTYDLHNPAVNVDIIRAFTLTFPEPLVSEYTNILPAPVDWTWTTTTTQIQWSWDVVAGNPLNRLDPGETFVFGFTSPRPPGSPAHASALNQFSFDGPTRGPLIPEATTVMLGLMGLSTLVGFRRLRR